MKFLIFLGVIIIAIVRIVLYFISKVSHNTVIAQIKKNPSRAKEYMNNLDLPIQKKQEISGDGFNLIKTKIQSSAQIGNYKILYALPVDDNQLLVFSELAFTDIEAGVGGGTYDVKKKVHHSFLLKHDQERNELDVYSDLFVDATGKFQKQEFLPSLYSTTVSQ